MAFIGGEPQLQVTGPTLQVGEFFVNRGSHRLYIQHAGSAAPTNVSLARFDTALIVKAANVTLQGPGFRYYVGSAAPHIPTNIDGSNPGKTVVFGKPGGRVDRCVFFWNGHGGLSLNNDMIVERSQFVSNGWNGMGANSNGSKIRGNYIAYNNVEGFNTSWGAAGIKLGTSGFTHGRRSRSHVRGVKRYQGVQ